MEAAYVNETLHKEVSVKLLDEASRSVDVEAYYWNRQTDAMHVSASLGFEDVNRSGGSFCLSVSRHPEIPNRIYKLCTADPQKDPYILYADWVFTNGYWRDNPHFPRIHDIAYSDDGNVALVTLEELSEFEFGEAPDYLLYDFYMVKYLLRNTSEAGLRGIHRPVDSGNRPLRTAAGMIHELFKENPYTRFDIHSKNIMLRGEIPVIIDPVSLA